MAGTNLGIALEAYRSEKRLEVNLEEALRMTQVAVKRLTPDELVTYVKVTDQIDEAVMVEADRADQKGWSASTRRQRLHQAIGAAEGVV